MITVITICYKDSEGLKRTHESLKRVPVDYFEWVIVNKENDANIDKLIEESSLKNIVYIEGKDNGIYDAMNIGLSVARGDYILYINSGDELVAAGLNAFRSIDTNSLSKYDLFFLQSLRVEKKGGSVLVRPKPYWYIYYSLPTLHQSIIYRKTDSLLKGYDLKYHICGDYAFTARLIKEGAKCKALPFLLSKFYLGGVSSQQPKMLAKEAMQIQISILGVPTLFASLMKNLRLIRFKIL